MANHIPGGPRPDSSRTGPKGLVRPRQLTIGECIAIGRYGPAIERRRKRRSSINDILALIDAMGVCTTCGYPESVHHGDQRWMTCKHWTRES